MKRYRPWNPDQSFLFPPSPHDWLPEGHLAYFLLDVVSELDLSAIVKRIQEKDHRGERPYDPQMMTALLLYAYSVGVYSSRRIERACVEDVAFRVISGGQQPHFTSVNQFRRRHIKALRQLFLQVLQLCRKAGLVKLGLVALDGTKVQGSASKHKAMSYRRMRKEEGRLKKEISALFLQAKAEDKAEDERFGEGQREWDLPAELQRRTDRLKRIQEARAELEGEARAARVRELRVQAGRARASAETSPDPVERKRAATRARQRMEKARALDDRDDDDPSPPTTDQGLPKHEPPTTPDGTPADRAQRNFTDPDSRIMERGGSFLQGYNCQAVVDEGHQVVVACGVSNKSPDNGNLTPMLEQVRRNCGQGPAQACADAGYWSPEAATRCGEVDLYISTERRKHSDDLEHEAPARPPPASDDAREQMRAKLRTPKGRQLYSRRKYIVEPVFGQVKEARGFRRFLLRGLTSVQAEWSLLCTAHNLLKLYRNQAAPATA